MAEDNRTAKLQLQVDTPGIKESIDRLNEMKRAADLTGLASEFEKAIKSGQDVDKALASVNETLKKIGATEPEIEKVAEQIAALGKAKPLADTTKNASALQKELGKLSRATDLDKLAKEFGEIARQTDDVAGAVDELTKKLKGLGATDDEIKGVARAFETERSRSFDAPRSGGSSGGGGAPAAAKFRGAASLVGGGEIVGLIDDLQDLGEGFSQLASQSGGLGSALVNTLTPAMGSTAAGVAVAGAAFAAAGVAIVALGAVLKAFVDEQAKAQAVVEGIVDAQRDVNQKINRGATTEDLTSERDLLLKDLQDEEDALKRLRDQYDQQINSQGALAPLIKATSGAEEGLVTSIAETEANINKLRAQADALNAGLSDSDLAANDAKVAEQELASTRETQTTQSIEKVSDAEKDRQREQEKAQQQAERAAEKAQQEAERNAERAAQAQDNYNKAVADAGRNLKQATEDINTKLGQNLADNLTGLLRDATDIASKYRQDEADLAMKARRSERDALADHLRDIDDIREEGRKSEQDAIREGDFKALFLARQATAENLRLEQRDTAREKSDRERAAGDERADLLRNAQRERADRLLNYERQNADARLNAQREIQQAGVNKHRALALAAEAYSAELKQLGQYLQARNQMMTKADQAALSSMARPTPGNGMIGNQAGIPAQTIPLRMLTGMIR